MEEITIVPIASLPECPPSEVHKIRVEIGDGTRTRFKVIIPFAIIVSWRLISCLDEVFQPDCLLRDKELIIHFGRPPGFHEFTLEILGVI